MLEKTRLNVIFTIKRVYTGYFLEHGNTNEVSNVFSTKQCLYKQFDSIRNKFKLCWIDYLSEFLNFIKDFLKGKKGNAKVDPLKVDAYLLKGSLCFWSLQSSIPNQDLIFITHPPAKFCTLVNRHSLTSVIGHWFKI